MEKGLQGITEKQSFNVNGLIELVKENESILVQMRVRRTFLRSRTVFAFGLTNTLNCHSLTCSVFTRKI